MLVRLRIDGTFVARRRFLAIWRLAGAVAGGLGWLTRPALAEQLAKDHKRVIVDQHGGRTEPVGKLGPQTRHRHRRSLPRIPTSVPGIHIQELLPHTAKQMHHLASSAA